MSKLTPVVLEVKEVTLGHRADSLYFELKKFLSKETPFLHFFGGAEHPDTTSAIKEVIMGRYQLLFLFSDDRSMTFEIDKMFWMSDNIFAWECFGRKYEIQKLVD